MIDTFKTIKRESNMKYFALTAALLMSTPAFSADMKIEMLNKDAEGNRQVYSEEVARIDVGDTITWVPTNKGHNIEMVASPNNMKLRSKNNKEVQITFEEPGIYYYWCTPHKGMGMIGLVVVGDDTSNKDQIAKAKAIGKSKKKLKKLLDEL
jgi:pseudoazurin